MKQKNDLLNEVKDKLSNKYYLDQREQELVNDCVDELLKAINYTRCCEMLAVLDRCECAATQEEPIKICTNCNGYLE